MGIGNLFLFPYVLISAFLKLSRIIMVDLQKKWEMQFYTQHITEKRETAGKKEKNMSKDFNNFFLLSISQNFLSHRSVTMNNSLKEQQQQKDSMS